MSFIPFWEALQWTSDESERTHNVWSISGALEPISKHMAPTDVKGGSMLSWTVN